MMPKLKRCSKKRLRCVVHRSEQTVAGASDHQTQNSNRPLLMKSFNKRYRHLIGLFCIIGIALGLFMLGLPAPASFGLVALWQLSQFVMSKKPGCCFIAGLTPGQVQEFERILDGLKSYDGMFKDLSSW